MSIAHDIQFDATLGHLPVPQVSAQEPKRPLHRIADVRKRQGISARSAARRAGPSRVPASLANPVAILHHSLTESLMPQAVLPLAALPFAAQLALLAERVAGQEGLAHLIAEAAALPDPEPLGQLARLLREAGLLGRRELREALVKTLRKGDVIGVITQKDPKVAEPGASDLHEMGTFARVSDDQGGFVKNPSRCGVRRPIPPGAATAALHHRTSAGGPVSDQNATTERPASGPTRTRRQRLRYRFDLALSRGPSVVIGWLGLTTLAIIALGAVVVALFSMKGVNGDREGTLSFPEALWQAMLRIVDAGTFAADAGWGTRLLGLLITLCGIFIAGSLIGLIASGLDQRIDELRRGRSDVIEADHSLILGWSSRVPARCRRTACSACATSRSGCSRPHCRSRAGSRRSGSTRRRWPCCTISRPCPTQFGERSTTCTSRRSTRRSC